MAVRTEKAAVMAVLCRAARAQQRLNHSRQGQAQQQEQHNHNKDDHAAAAAAAAALITVTLPTSSPKAWGAHLRQRRLHGANDEPAVDAHSRRGDERCKRRDDGVGREGPHQFPVRRHVADRDECEGQHD